MKTLLQAVPVKLSPEHYKVLLLEAGAAPVEGHSC